MNVEKQLELNPQYESRACKDVDPNIFFPDTKQGEQIAKGYCVNCVIRLACKEYAITTKQDIGVYGGLSESERRRIRRRDRANSSYLMKQL